MNNERAIELLDDLARCVNCGEIELNEEDGEALRMAIEALKNERPRFVHVTFKHKRFGEVDAWLDKKRNILFFDYITVELAKKYNWEWEEADNDSM